MIAGQDEVIAVVDHQTDRGIEVGTAAAASLPRLLVEDDMAAALGETHRSRKSGDASADDVNRTRLHQNKRALINASSTRAFGVRTRIRGAFQPRAFSFSRMR